MRVTVCQIPNEPAALDAAWGALREHLTAEASDLLVLPEMPFAPWLAASRDVDREQWSSAATMHGRWCDRLGELGVGVALGSRPVEEPDPRNRAFLWNADGGLRDLHDKAYLPDEEGFWEATWYNRGKPEYELATVVTDGGARARIGVLLCTEMWFLEHARAYGRAGAHILAIPRATPGSTLDKWIAGGRTTAVVSGAYCLSAAPYNKSGQGADLGGGSWIIDPEGEVLALTTPEEPFATREIDLARAEAAKRLYPRYVPEAE